MAVEDHPAFSRWDTARVTRNEAEERYRKAQMESAPDLPLHKKDLDKAQADYDAICDELDNL